MNCPLIPAQTLSIRGLIYHQLGLYAEAQVNYLKAADEFQAAHDFHGVGQTCCQLSTLMLEQQQYAEARYWAEIAVYCFVKAEQYQGHYSLARSYYAAALHLLGMANFYQGRYNLALRQFHKVISIRCELQDEVGEALTLTMMGRVYQAQQQLWFAQACYKGALEIAQTRIAIFEGGWFVAQLHTAIAELYEASGHTDLALEHQQQSVACQTTVTVGISD